MPVSSIKDSSSVGSIAQVKWQGDLYKAKIKELGYDRKLLESNGALLLVQSDDEEDNGKKKTAEKRKLTSVKSSRKRLLFKPEGIGSAPPLISPAQFYGKPKDSETLQAESDSTADSTAADPPPTSSVDCSKSPIRDSIDINIKQPNTDATETSLSPQQIDQGKGDISSVTVSDHDNTSTEVEKRPSHDVGAVDVTEPTAPSPGESANSDATTEARDIIEDELAMSNLSLLNVQACDNCSKVLCEINGLHVKVDAMQQKLDQVLSLLFGTTRDQNQQSRDNLNHHAPSVPLLPTSSLPPQSPLPPPPPPPPEIRREHMPNFENWSQQSPHLPPPPSGLLNVPTECHLPESPLSLEDTSISRLLHDVANTMGAEHQMPDNRCVETTFNRSETREPENGDSAILVTPRIATISTNLPQPSARRSPQAAVSRPNVITKLAECGVTEHTWAMLRKGFKSAKTLSVGLMKTMFSDAERLADSNFKGGRGRAMMDPTGRRNEAIYNAVMMAYPCTTKSDITRAIDSANRQFRRSHIAKQDIR